MGVDGYMPGKNIRTFIIQVKGTVNGTWQGTVDWVEENERVAFRSALELIRLMDSSISIQEEKNRDEKNKFFERKVEEQV